MTNQNKTKIVGIVLAAFLLVGFVGMAKTSVATTPTTWVKTLGTAEYDDVFRGLEVACDGGYIIAAETNGTSTSGTKDMFLTKVDQYGTRVWQKIVNHSVQNDDDSFRDIENVSCSPNERHVLVGNSKGDIYVTLIDGSGVRQWQKLFGTAKTENVNAVDVIPSGG